MKKLTFILSMMLALVGLNANAAMYIVGATPFGNWNPGAGVEMTANGDGTYSYTVELNGQVGFVFGDGLNNEWSVFNANHRYGPANGNTTIQAGDWINTSKAGDHGCYYFTGTGESYVFTFDENNNRFKVEGYVAPIEESYTVCGDNATIFGTTWDPENTANDMTLDETDGLYKLVKENVVITAGTLYYKVAKNHGWAESWGNPEGPSGNQDYYFNENGTYNLTFKFNLETKEVTLDAEQTAVGPQIDPYTGHLYMVGQVNDNAWNPAAGIEMVNAGDSLNFTLANAQIVDSGDGFGYFSFISMLGASNESWPADGYRIGAAEDATLAIVGQNNMGGFPSTGAFKIEPGYYNFSVNLAGGENGVLTITAGEAPQPVVDDVYIIGDVNNIGWVANDGVKMTYNEGIYTAEITTQNQGDLGVAYFGFTKQLADSANGWDDITAYRFGPMSNGAFVMTEELLNVNCELDLEGSYESIAIPEGTWTVTVDLANGLFKINGTWPTDTVTPQPETNVYIIGEVNDNGGWFTNKGVQMTLNEGVYTANISTAGENNGLSYFSFTKQLADSAADWDAIAPYRFGAVSDGDFIMTEELLGVECALATDGSYNAIALPAGEWTLTVDLVNNKFTINGEWPETPGPEPYTGDVYILGEVNDNGGWFTNVGAKMNRDAENNVYTLTITTTGSNIDENDGIGYSYFSFTKQLADSAADWDAIAPYRFGAVSDGDFLVTEEQLNKELSLEMGGDAYKIVAGKWNLTLSVDNMTLKIEKVAGLRGDVNNDEAVNIADVSALIDYLLTEDATDVNLDNANCNLDDGVNIADVSALIDYLLTEVW